MSSKHVAGLAGARLHKASKAPAMAWADQHKVNCNICAMPEASFTSGWYRPERLMSQSERLQS
jgi:hypothetical protein